ncbi:MAG: hypothetical protein M3R25_02395 [Bacteroidota bacterium]|nr:hypothetical protein [Bacteroidota bacterium]
MKGLFLIAFIMASFAVVANANNDHDIHLSMCELRYNEQSSTFEVSIKIFIDDLELALKKYGVSNLRIGTPDESEIAEEHISTYLNQQFTIDIDGHRITPTFVGKEVTEDMLAVWCYLEYKTDVSRDSKCILSNRVLFEVHDDQRNIMDIRMGRSHKDYTILDSTHTTWNYTF